MKVFRIAVCEDDSPSRDFETKLINNWAEKSALNVNIDSYTSAENFLFESEDKLEYDLLLLDIQMGKMNGVELARVLRKRGFSGALVFLTGVKDYAIEGYEVGAVRYLLKPIKEEDFFKTLSLVYADFDKQKEDVKPLNDNFIVEPDMNTVLSQLMPKMAHLMLYTALLDSNASEHAARMVAMQTATDNADELLRELNLQYNKSRQQAITSELLDIVGGSVNN